MILGQKWKSGISVYEDYNDFWKFDFSTGPKWMVSCCKTTPKMAD